MRSLIAHMRRVVGIVAVIAAMVSIGTTNGAPTAYAEPDTSSSQDDKDGSSQDAAPNSQPSRVPETAAKSGNATDEPRRTTAPDSEEFGDPTVGPTIDPTDVPTITIEPSVLETVISPTPTTEITTTTTSIPPTTTTMVTTTTTTVTETSTAAPGLPLLRFLLRITVATVQYLVSLPVNVAAATFVLAHRIFHYIVDHNTVRITGHQHHGSDALHPGLPPDVTVENVQRVKHTSHIQPAGMLAAPPSSPEPVSGPLVAAAGVALLILFGALAWRSRRDDARLTR